jgi:hypothetical protein
MSEPITFPNANYGSAINPGNGAFDAQMLVAALGFASGDPRPLGVAVSIGALAAPDYRGDQNNPQTWLWKPDTVQSYMTGTAAATVRAAVAAQYAAGRVAH